MDWLYHYIMQIITKEDLKVRKKEIIQKIRDGHIFIYPTDTIYGIGCNALNDDSVKKIREIKGRQDMPFSIIAPNKAWIRQYCETGDKMKFIKWIKEIPGPVTLILKLKDEEAISEETNKGIGTLGVRIPNHWISELVEEAGIPIITTSANKVGEDSMTSIEDLDPEIKRYVDFIIYEGELHGRPSKLINLTLETPEIIER